MADRTLAQIIAALETDVYGKNMRADIVELAEKLNDIVSDAIEHQLIEVDATLTQSGQGADAAVVGTRLNEKADTGYVDYKVSDKVNNYNGSIENGLVVGTNIAGAYNHNKAMSVGDANLAAYNSAAIGYGCSSGYNSLAVGNGVSASNNQLVVGESNADDSNHDYYFIIGKGNSSNAHTVDKSGNAWFSGNVKVGGDGYGDSAAKELATKEYVDSASPFVGLIIQFAGTPQSGTCTGTISGSALKTAINNGKIPLFTLRYDINPSDPTDSSISVRRVCQCLILDKYNNTATVMYDYDGATYLVTIAWADSSSTNYTLTLNALATAADISNAIGGSY